MMKKALTALSGLAMAAGLVVVMIPTFTDWSEHWALFVSRMNYFVPGMILLMGGAIGLAVLDRK